MQREFGCSSGMGLVPSRAAWRRCLLSTWLRAVLCIALHVEVLLSFQKWFCPSWHFLTESCSVCDVHTRRTYFLVHQSRGITVVSMTASTQLLHSWELWEF